MPNSIRLATVSLQPYPVELMYACRNPDGTTLSIAGGVGLWRVQVGTAIRVRGEDAQSNTKTDYFKVEKVLSPEYLDGQDLQVRIHARYTGTGTVGATHTLDLEAYRLDATGVATPDPGGSDICATAVQTLTNAWADYLFTITPATLIAGDRLKLRGVGRIQETGGVNPLTVEVGSITVLMDTRG